MISIDTTSVICYVPTSESILRLPDSLLGGCFLVSNYSFDEADVKMYVYTVFPDFISLRSV